MIDNKKLTKDFKRLIASDRLFHAYLFFGDVQAGSDFVLSLANFFEKGIFELPAENAILQESLIISPDEKETIGIDKIRSLLHFLSQKPVLSEKRTVIVRNAENLTNEAQNAILKIAEEPPPQSLMIFIAKSEDFFLPALISRLQKIYFSFTRFKEDLMRERVDLSKTSVEKIVENNQIDQFFESLILNLRRDP
ncbi:MAG: polymerase III, delta prime subunit protein, partial [Candidatus Wolfebacteria bacterium GW2011_GWA2_42_10]